MKVTNFLWLLSWSSLLLAASPLEERAASSAVCNNAQVKALQSSSANCYCSSYLSIPVSTITKLTTRVSTIQTTVTKKQIMTKISISNIKSTVSIRFITASSRTGYTTTTKVITVTPRAPSLHVRKHLEHPRELVERAGVSTCATPAVVRGMNRAAISSACKCLSIAPRRTTIIRTTTKVITQVSTKLASFTSLRTTTIRSSVTALATFTPLKLITRTATITVTATAKSATSSKLQSLTLSSVRNEGVSGSTTKTSSRLGSSLATIQSSISLPPRTQASSSKSMGSTSISGTSSASPVLSPPGNIVTAIRPSSVPSTTKSAGQPSGISGSSRTTSIRSSSTTSISLVSTVVVVQPTGQTSPVSALRSSSKTTSVVISTSSNRSSSTTMSKPSSYLDKQDFQQASKQQPEDDFKGSRDSIDKILPATGTIIYTQHKRVRPQNFKIIEQHQQST
ncbi:hypothetical protein E4T39_00692 [Aureobasidium subglaciale]|nr:hypothetical protein E4T39_00692 [Aureobasidium subglaciale]